VLVVDTIMGTMGSKGNLTRENQKGHLRLQPNFHLCLLLEVLCHLGVRLCLEVYHLLPKGLLPLLGGSPFPWGGLPLSPVGIPPPKLWNLNGGLSKRLEIGHWTSGRKPANRSSYWGSHHRCLDPWLPLVIRILINTILKKGYAVSPIVLEKVSGGFPR
jgi:hypothetical protein